MTAAEFLDTPTPTAPSRGMSAADYLDLPKASEFLEAGQDDAEPPAAAASGDVGRTFLNALLSSARPWATTDYGGRGVHLPSQTSSGFAGPPSAQNMDDWGLVAAMANAGKQEPMAQHLFDFGKNLVTMPLAMPVQAAGELAEQPATDVLNTLARDFTGKMPFQPGKPILSPPDPGTRGVVPAIERTVAGMTTPGNIAMLGLAPGSKLLQGGFLANAAASVPDSFEKMATATNADDLKEAATELGLNVGMAALMARGLSKEQPSAPRENANIPSGQETHLPSARNKKSAPAKNQPTVNVAPNVDEIIRDLFPAEVPPKKSKILGGAYKDIEADGGEAHHMPAKSVSTLLPDEGPAIWMEKEDHYHTKSWGNSTEAQEFKAGQAELINQGKFREAMQMDIDDIRSKFGNKYDTHIQQMLDYYDTIPAWKLRPRK